MRERTHRNALDAAQETPGTRFRRRFRGYDVDLVDDAMSRLNLRIHDLETQAVELREELLDAQNTTSEARHDLNRAKAELRYWNDRASYVDSEVARARQRAVELESAARKRADAIESDAQERSLQLIDRVCSEANTMLLAAREEAREMFLRFEADVDMSQQRLEQLEKIRSNVARTMHNAMQQFEDAVSELDKVAPARRIVEVLEQPVRRAVPTFGQQRALEAADRFAATSDQSANAALSSPVSETLQAAVKDVEIAETRLANAEAANPTATQRSRKVHDADDEFAALLMQP